MCQKPTIRDPKRYVAGLCVTSRPSDALRKSGQRSKTRLRAEGKSDVSLHPSRFCEKQGTHVDYPKRHYHERVLRKSR